MALKNIAKETGIAVLSLGILAGCSEERTTDEFYTEDDLNTWADENGLFE